MIFSKKIAEILRKKDKLKEDRNRIVDKLRKQQKLSGDEFWQVYDSIWQKGPEVKYQNPQNWISSGE